MKRILLLLAVLLLLPARAVADTTSPFTGYHAYQGLRYSEQIVVTEHSVSSPSNYANAPLPGNVATDQVNGPAAVATIVKASSNSYLNSTCWSSPITVAPTGAPMVPVRLWQSGWATSGVPNYMRQLQGVLADGVPIPSGWAPETCQGDSDNEGVFYSPSLDKSWELWRLRPCDPASCDGFSYTAQAGGRMSYVHSNPGHWVNRTNGAAYPNLPSDPAKRATFEDHAWGATAAKLPRLDLEITREDIQSGVIPHALIFSMPPQYIQKGLVWPAQGYDGYASSGVKEGSRFRLDPLTDCALGNVVESEVCAAARDYGIVLGDRSGSLAFYADSNVDDLLGGVAKSRLFAGFPWDRLELLAAGSDSAPDPVA